MSVENDGIQKETPCPGVHFQVFELLVVQACKRLIFVRMFVMSTLQCLEPIPN